MFQSNCQCSFPCSFPQHVLGPNDLLCTNRLIMGSSVSFLFDSSGAHNFITDHLILIMGLQTRLSDRMYKVHLVDGGIQYINGVIHELPDTYEERFDFHVMSLRSTYIILGYPWFFNKKIFIVYWLSEPFNNVFIQYCSTFYSMFQTSIHTFMYVVYWILILTSIM